MAAAQVAYLADLGERSAANVGVNQACGEGVAGANGIYDFHDQTAVAGAQNCEVRGCTTESRAGWNQIPQEFADCEGGGRRG